MIADRSPLRERRARSIGITRYLGLDLGGTNIKVVVLEGGGAIISKAAYPTRAAEGPIAVRDRLAALANATIAEHGPVAALGVGLPGVTDAERGAAVLLPNLPGAWAGLPVRDPIASATGLPVGLINDCRAFALAESLLGAGRGRGTVVCLVLGTGVGGGVVIDGKVHHGAGGAGEIGHQTVLADGPPCGCGNLGCVEALTRSDVFARLGGRDTPEQVYLGARDGDPRARAAVDQVVGWLGIALANAYALLAPDLFVVGGGIAGAGRDLLDPLASEVRRRVRIVPAERIAVVPGELGPYAGAIGAALWAREGAEAQPTAREFGPAAVNTASMT